MIRKLLSQVSPQQVEDWREGKYRKDYLSFMSDLISHSYAAKVPAEESVIKNGQVWYIAYHGVYRPKKTGKIRVVFDCGVEFAGVS